MNDYIQYIEIDENNNIKNAFTSAQEENYPNANKISIGTGLRQFNFNKHFPNGLIDMTGKRNYKWNPDEKKIEKIPEDTAAKIEKQKEAELQELKRKAKEEIFERFLSEEKSLVEIAEEVKAKFGKT